MLCLRPAATAADVRAAARFMEGLRRGDEKGCAAHGSDPGEVAPLHAGRPPEAPAETLAAPGTCLMIAARDDRAPCCGGRVTAGPGLAGIVRFFVDPAARGQGVGRGS